MPMPGVLEFSSFFYRFKIWKISFDAAGFRLAVDQRGASEHQLASDKNKQPHSAAWLAANQRFDEMSFCPAHGWLQHAVDQGTCQ